MTHYVIRQIKRKDGKINAYYRDTETGCIILVSPTDNCQIGSLTRPYKIFLKDKQFFEAHIEEIRKKSGLPLLLLTLNARYLKKLKLFLPLNRIILEEEFENDKNTKIAVCLIKIN